MENIFLKILNISITASWLVLAVLLMRLLLRKAPRYLSVIMWALVGIRLLLPFSFESALSLIPSTETIPPEILYEKSPQIQTGFDTINSAINPVISESFAPTPGASVNPLQVITFLAGWIWVIGMAAMAIYSLISCLRLRRQLREAMPLKDNIYLCDRIETPFIFGLFRPKIYLPSSMASADIPLVLAHEQAHLQRRDHIWKPLGFLLLTVYWFNPLLWVAYILLCRDIEAACDEKVLADMGEEVKKPYSQALVNCSVPRKMVAACPLAFGEVNVKSRIQKVLNYKKPAFWLLIAAVVVCIALSVCFLTNPQTVNKKMQVFLDCAIADHFQTDKSAGNACCLDYRILGTEKKGKTTTVYMWVLYEEYSYQNGRIDQESGSHIVTAITARKEDGNYRLIEYWEPRDGGYYTDDIKAKFPMRLWLKALDSQRYIQRQKKACRELAEEYFLENPVGSTDSAALDELRKKYPQYFDLPTANGLVVYQWQMAENSHCWGLLSGGDSHEMADLLALVPASLEEIRLIVDSYGLSPEQITVCPIRMHYSSYYYPIDDAYEKQIAQMFWSGSISPEDPYGVDDWGLRMELTTWTDHFVTNAVFYYHPDADSPAGELTTTSEYKLYAIYNGKRMPIADFVRKVLGQDYPAQKASTQWITYTITAEEPLYVPVNLNDLGIDLPSGIYEVVKEVQLRNDAGIQIREYSVEFGILDDGPAYEPPDTDISHITVTFAGGDSEHLAGIWEEALNPDKLALSSQRHLPVLKFETREALEAFMWKYVNVSSHSAAGWDEVPPFQAVAAQYDEAFFEENTLILVYVPCGNCTHRFDVLHVFQGRGSLSIRIYETTGAEVVADAVANWFITMAVPKSATEVIGEYDAMLVDS